MKRKITACLITLLAIGAVMFTGCVEETPPPTPAVTSTPEPTIISSPTLTVEATPTPTVAPISPTSKASVMPTSVTVGESIAFDGSDSTDPDGTITSYEWNFGDDNTVSGATVNHSYSNSGTFVVTLTVTDNDGLPDTDTIKITVKMPIYTLSEALDNDFATAEITGSGASSGDSLNLKLTRKTSNSIEITVPKGTVMHASGGAQDMVVWKLRGIPEGTQWIIPVSKIVLDSSEPQTFILEAYCLDFHKDNPSSSTRFSVGALTDPQILKIFNAVDSRSSDITSVAAIQTAIWVVTEDVSENELLNRFPVAQNDINNAQIILEEVGIDTASKRLFQ
jgi:PKD repeat protein